MRHRILSEIQLADLPTAPSTIHPTVCRSARAWSLLRAAMVAGAAFMCLSRDLQAQQKPFTVNELKGYLQTNRKLTLPKYEVVIDGSSFQARGDTSFPRPDQVIVFIDSKNPYKYNYRFTTSIERLDVSMAAELLKPLGIPAIFAPSPDPVKPQGGPLGVAAVNPGGRTCKADALKRASALERRATDVEALLTASLASKQRHFKRTDDFLAAIRQDVIDPQAVYSQAEALARDVLPGLLETGAIEEQLDRFEEALTAADEAFAELDCAEAAAAKERLERLRKENLAKAKLSVAALKTKAGLDATKASVEVLRQRIESVAGDPEAFVQHVWISRQPEASKVTLTGLRQDMLAQSASMSSYGNALVINMGKPLFTLSGGVAFSSLGDQKVIRAPQGEGAAGAAPPQVFGYGTNSSYRPMLAMVGTVWVKEWENGRYSFGPGFGLLAAFPPAGTSNGTASASLEYLVGPSFGLGNRLMLFTAGVHLGRRELLRNYEIGKPVPAGLADPLPVQNNWKAGFGVAITLRIR